MATGPVHLRDDWQHTDGKAHTRLPDSWDEAEGVHKFASLVWDTGTLAWVRGVQAGGGAGGGGDASAANQTTEISKLDAILTSVGLRTKPSDQQHAIIDSSALPSGAATSSLQGTGNASVASIDGKTPALGQALAAGSVPVVLTVAQLAALAPLTAVGVNNFPATQPVTVVDGGNVTQGAKADAAWDGAAASPTLVAIQKYAAAKLDAIRVLLAGTLVITGNVGLTGTASTSLSSIDTNQGAQTDVESTGNGTVIAILKRIRTLLSGTLAVSGTFWQATQPVSLATNTPDVTDRAGRLLGVIASITAAITAKIQDSAGTAITQKAASTAAVAADPAIVVALSPNSPVLHQPSTLVGTTLSTSATAVTLTLAAAGAGLFHYITRIEIVRVSTAAVTGSAVLGYTSTNLPGTWARSAGNAIAIGATVKDVDEVLSSPLKSSAANTATTIIAPSGGTGVQVRITVYYYTGP